MLGIMENYIVFLYFMSMSVPETVFKKQEKEENGIKHF